MQHDLEVIILAHDFKQYFYNSAVDETTWSYYSFVKSLIISTLYTYNVKFFPSINDLSTFTNPYSIQLEPN